MKFYITGIRRGLGKFLYDNLETAADLESCDIFINCKHDGFSQVELLKRAAELGKTIINIGSIASDWPCATGGNWQYSVEKMSLETTNTILFYKGIKTTLLKFGWLDTESSAHVNVEKIDKEYVLEIILWILIQPYRIKDITITPQ
jgi:NADP-dependent 3-hydroxy acid dehydrogenase YdfG